LPSNTKTTGTKWGLFSESTVASLATVALFVSDVEYASSISKNSPPIYTHQISDQINYCLHFKVNKLYLQVIFGTAMFFTGAERVGLIFQHV
jgi:hypothetical protein